MTSSPVERSAAAVEIPPAVIGLRERKKARTRATIRAEAIRLFSEQGFVATTVEQIAEAAEVSPSTFFRYFPTKEAVIITDEYDPLIFQEFRNQPADVPAVRAFRNAIRTVFGQMTPAGLEQEQIRQQLLRSVPELRSAMLEEFGMSLQFLAEMIGERVGRPADDLPVRALAGAIIGVVLSVTLAAWNATTGPDQQALMTSGIDAALEQLELGLPI
jgi:AcrR family transcriptional regulator